MIKIVLPFIALSGLLFASDTAQTDIVMRTVNFVLFASIMYYLVADKVKAFFKARTQGIIDEHEKVQNRLRETKLAKSNAEKKVEDAKKVASDILSVSKKENAFLNEKIIAQMDVDIKNLENQHQTSIAYEQRKMVSDVVETVMTEVLSDKNIPLDDAAMTDIIMRKVA